MGKKKSKNKKKKVNVKKERYAKFRKEQPTMTFTTPDLTPEQQKQKQEDERNIDMFWRYNRRRPVVRGIGAKKGR